MFIPGLHITDELDGVNAKLTRADAHLDAVKSALKDLTDSEPDLIPGEFDRRARVYVFRAQRDSLSPTVLSSVIGDCVHNFRTALDYIVWELVAIAGHSGSTATEFPVFTDPKRYATDAPRKIRGVPSGAEAIFEKLQPFYGPNSNPFDAAWREPAEEPLALLYELDRWDKHRSLNLTEDNISATLVGFEQLGVIVPPTPAKLPGRFKRGAILAAAEMSLDRPDVNVYLRAAYDIAFDRGGPAAGEPVIQTLTHIRQEVRERVIPAFRPFFPRH
jgi:hypothetical protein